MYFSIIFFALRVDAHGYGSYTCCKLRGLGTALGFQVDRSAEKGIFIKAK